ncbi:ATP-binding cassette domain-containing protein [Massilia dura]|uniref:ATP-binding cassette domain-containing protein n=1 Tax=Pseudoduganella dura TaxID=321982 RepID=A0A6I3XWE4_9BURK|nr:ABC transporter ATP-binding protein [Pseudoduganella dura]MUI16085.1 ATP-binding cassette domain-containing protein [Pseudoduganella dura]GGY11895.1 multidrug ABC transporter [Pseudoduganella dura]
MTGAASSASAPPQFTETVDLHAMPRVLGRLTGLALRHPWRCAAAVSCALGAAIFNLVMPRLLGRAVDQAGHLVDEAGAALAGADHALAVTALLIVAACAIRGTLTGLQGYCGETLAQRVAYDLRLAFHDKLQQLSFGYHDRMHTGELIARGMLDLEGVRAFLEFGVLRAITLALLLGVGSWRLLSVDASLGLLALSFVPFVLLVAVGAAVRLRASWQRLQKMMAELTLRMEENLQGVRVVRAFHAKAAELARFDGISQRALRLSNARITERMGSISLMTFAYYVSMALVLWVGGRRVAAGGLTVGALTEFLAFITILQQPLRQIGMVVNSSARATGSGARLFEVLDATPEIADRAGAIELPPGPKTLRFENVGFGYAAGGRKVLRDVSFEVKPGQVLGIVGAPGSGKSTIAHLIPRFYDAGGGRVTLGGHDLRDVTLASLRRDVALVQQENFLFDTSVHDNVAYAAPDAAHAEVAAAAGIAQIHDHVARLPDGYRTRVGERGAALSGGQRQRVTIARALVGDPAVIVLDDSTAAIDPVTEGRVREALQVACRDAATVVIAHRVGTLRHADHIVVLDGGVIAERGDHASLLAAGGRYAELWSLQHRSSLDEAPEAAEPLAQVGT